MPLDPAILADLLASAANAAAYDPATPIYLAAMTSSPTDVAQGTECTGDGYVRCMVTPSSAFALVSGEWVNSSDIVFAAATDTWPDDIVAISAYDDATATDHRQWYYVLAAPVAVASGNALRIPSGDLIISF